MFHRFVLCVFVLALSCPDSPAGPLRRMVENRRSSGSSAHSSSASFGEASNTAYGIGEGGDALDVVNEWRKSHGYREYERDPALTEGALACARYRAANRIQFHTDNDFRFLPPGASAASGGAGTGGYGPWGFLACWAREHGPRCAGAAWVKGADGRMYCQMFVR